MFPQAETPKCLVEAKYLCPLNGHSPGVAWSQLASPTHFDLSLNLVRTTSIYNGLAPVVNMLSYGGGLDSDKLMLGRSLPTTASTGESDSTLTGLGVQYLTFCSMNRALNFR
jgi:hypothetical protein